MTNKTSKRVFLALLWTGASFATWAQSPPELKTLFTFSESVNGVAPNNSVTVGKGGVLYGTTVSGGKFESGVAFSLTPPASPGGSWTEAVLSNFEGNGATRENPTGRLVAGANGVLYGSTMGGSSNFGNGSFNGTVYSLRPPSTAGNPWARTALCSFAPKEGPIAIAMGAKGVLYGVTEVGGTNLSGVLFSCAPPVSSGDGWSENVLYNVPSGGGSNFPTNLVIGSGGIVYSTSNATVSTGGSVFSLTPPASSSDAWTPASLFGFPNTADGGDPDGLTIGGGGVLYGSALLGGNTTAGNCNPAGCGVVFALTPPASPGGAWTQVVLHTFSDSPDGAFPYPLAVGPSGVLYGSTYSGGTFGDGTLYSLTPPTSPEGSWTYALLYSFTGGSDSGTPNGLTPGPNGVLYGTTAGAGSPGYGTVFSFRP